MPVSPNDGGVYRTPFGTVNSGNWFKDNIVACLNSSGAELLFNTQLALTDFATADFDYNLYYNDGNTARFYHVSGFQDGIANWQAASGRDTNSSVGNPSFDNAAAFNFKRTGSGDTGSSTGGVRGCYITGSEEIGLRANPTY
jgi:hypothetical protein